jgi:hypothetical protein
MNIIEKAFSGEWISESEIRAFSEEYQNEFGLVGNIKNRISIGNARKGVRTGGQVGGDLGALGAIIAGLTKRKYGRDLTEFAEKGRKRGGTAGKMIGATVGALSKTYQVIFLDDKGNLSSVISSAPNERLAINSTKVQNRKGSEFKCFKFPEDMNGIIGYIHELSENGAGALNGRYQVIFLNAGEIDSEIVTSSSSVFKESAACSMVKRENPKGYAFKAFKFPEDLKEINDYIKTIYKIKNK